MEREYVEIATVDTMSRGNLGMVWGECLHQILRLGFGHDSLCVDFHHQALRTGLPSPFGLTSSVLRA